MRQFQKVVMLLVLLLSILSVTAVQDSSCIYYFYGSDCQDCLKTDSYLDEFKNKNPGVQIETYEVYYERENFHLLENLFETYNVPEESRGIPAVLSSKEYFIGSSAIENLLEGSLSDTISCPSVDQEKERLGIVSDEKTPYDVMKILTFGHVTSAGFQDALKPVMIALVLIMLAFLSVIKEEEEVVKKGSIFVVITFLFIIISGLTSFAGFGQRASFLFYRIIGFIAILVGLVKIKGFVSTWKVFLKTIPETVKEKLRVWRNSALTWKGILAISIISSLFALVGNSKIFQLLQALFKAGEFRVIIFPMILYYSLLAVLPLIIVVVALRVVRQFTNDDAEEKGEKSEHVEKKWKKYYHRIINFVVSIVMFIIGLILLFI